MRHQVELRLRHALDEMHLEAKTLAAEIDINPPHLEKLRDGTWTHITKTDLQRLLCWGRKHNRELLQIVENPLWRTFAKQEVVVFRGKSDKGNLLASDSNVEKELLEALEQEECKVDTRALDSEAAKAQVPDLLKTRNCIFIGSPKLNVASEVALASLWGLTPFDGSKRNRERSPLVFVWEPSHTGKGVFGRPREGNENIGIYVGARDASGVVTKRYCVPADWKPARTYAGWTGRAKDAGAMVVCCRPLNTEADVTTIVLAGHSGFATHDMAKDLVSDGLRFETDELRPSTACMKVLSAPYKKLSGLAGSRVRIAKGRRWFELPWTELEVFARKQQRKSVRR